MSQVFLWSFKFRVKSKFQHDIQGFLHKSYLVFQPFLSSFGFYCLEWFLCHESCQRFMHLSQSKLPPFPPLLRQLFLFFPPDMNEICPGTCQAVLIFFLLGLWAPWRQGSYFIFFRLLSRVPDINIYLCWTNKWMNKGN